MIINLNSLDHTVLDNSVIFYNFEGEYSGAIEGIGIVLDFTFPSRTAIALRSHSGIMFPARFIEPNVSCRVRIDYGRSIIIKPLQGSISDFVSKSFVTYFDDYLSHDISDPESLVVFLEEHEDIFVRYREQILRNISELARSRGYDGIEDDDDLEFFDDDDNQLNLSKYEFQDMMDLYEKDRVPDPDPDPDPVSDPSPSNEATPEV